MQSLRERRPHRQTDDVPLASLSQSVASSPSSKFHQSKSASFFPIRFSLSTFCIAGLTLLNVVLLVLLFHSSFSPKVTYNPHPSSAPPHRRLPSYSTPPYDFFVTVYAYDRPRHLLNLLRDIAREADAARISVGVNVIDDNSYGCQFRPLSHNIYSPSSTDPRNPSIHTGDDAQDHDDDNTLIRVPLPSTLPCAAAYRFSVVERFIHARNWTLYVSRYRHSRRRYWHLVRHAHRLLRRIDAAFFVFLPDDDRLSRNFFPAVQAAWNAIRDDHKLTLMLHVEASREHVPVWTDIRPRVVSQNITRIGWVESGNFVTTAEFLRVFQWSFPYIPVRRWVDNPPISSGVGATLSDLIVKANRHMYRTRLSLVAHVGVTLSKMNAQFRTRNTPALLTKYFADGDDVYHNLLREAETVTASMASHWVREVSLHAAVVSLAPQVDRLNVYLNDYDGVPAFLRAPFIDVVCSGDVGAGGDIGDIGKFFWGNNLTTEFHATVDDDIIYPADYVDRLLAFRRTLKPPVVVAAHGIRLKRELLKPGNGRRGRGYYASRDVWMATEDVHNEVNVHIVGTGTMLYRVSEVGPLSLHDDFPKPNMADVWFGLLAQRLRLPMMVVPHDAGWIREVPGTFDDSIYKRSTRSRLSDRAQTQAVLSIPEWHLYNAQSVK